MSKEIDYGPWWLFLFYFVAAFVGWKVIGWAEPLDRTLTLAVMTAAFCWFAFSWEKPR